MPTFYSPSGNAEIWETAPQGYMTEDAWNAAVAAEEAAKQAEYNKIENVAARKLITIDAETSAAITTGFDYAVDGVSYHFSYDRDDQQNFADTANIALLAQMGGQGLPESVTWNAYKDWVDGAGELVRLVFTAASFLALYTSGAVAHKAARMAEGGARKAAVAEALASGATAEALEAI